MGQFDHGWRPTRRGLLASTVGTLTAGATSLLPAGGVFPAGSEDLRIGLIGCGGRGTGAARQAAAAHPAVRIVAMADLFTDHLAESAALLERTSGQQFACPPSHRFVGDDAWRRLLDSGVDAVILAATPWSRPVHCAEAVARGLHVYAERPAAADLTGIQVFRTACEAAHARGLVVVSGLVSRHHPASVETIARIRDGAIGRPRQVVCRASLGMPWSRSPQPSWTRHEARFRNWVASSELSGGPFLERHLDAIDRGLQAVGDVCPVSACPTRGDSGSAIRFQFATGASLVAEITCASGVRTWIDEWVAGTAGTADLVRHRIAGSSPWTHHGTAHDAWQACMTTFIRGIVHSEPADGGKALCQATLVALLGRTALEECREVTWSEVAGPTAALTGII